MLALNWLIALFFDIVNHDTEKFVLTALVLKGPRIILQVALVLIDNLSEDIMNAEDFDEIYQIIAKGPKKIKPETLRRQLQTNKKVDLTSKRLRAMREFVRPQVIQKLQEQLTLSLKPMRAPMTASNQERKVQLFLKQFYPFGFHLARYYITLKEKH